jgi:cytoskeleton protein RodZ
MENPEPMQAERPLTRTSPGTMLRAARENIGLERENVAEMLHLSTRQIDALENDEFGKLPGATYVRGYIRGYCQLLNIDYKTVADAYEAMTANWKTTTYSNLATERQATSRDNTVKLGTIAVAVFVFGLALIWWFGSDDRAITSKAPVEQANGTSGTVAEADVPGATEPVAGAEPAATEPTVKPAPAPAAPAAPVSVKPEPVKPATPPAVATVPGSAAPTAPATPSAVATAPTSAPITNASPAVSGRARVVIRTRDTSWIDIRDGNGEKMLYETVSPGRQIALEGVTPFAVFLGNPDAVDVELNGAAIDVAGFKRGVTARFTLGRRTPVNGN